MISINEYFVDKSPQTLIEGDKPVYVLTVPGVTTVTNDGTLAMYVYKKNTDVTSTCTTGSISSSGNVVTLKTIQSLVGGNNYVVSVFGTADGIFRCLGAIQLDVRRKSALQ